MISHTPTGYICPICIAISGEENEQTLIRQSDIVYKDELVTACISSFFIGNNSGHVIIVPNEHYENLYELPENVGNHIFSTSKTIVLAIKEAYNAEGITILQNNEPAGDQHAFHYHLHVFPRYVHDNLHAHIGNKKSTTPDERHPFAEKIKNVLNHK